MATVTHIREFGNELALMLDDGSRLLAYPTGNDLWKVANSSVYENVRPYGNKLGITVVGGAVAMCVPTGTGLWFRNLSGIDDGGEPGGDPGDPGDGTPIPPGKYSVIFPCDVHNVSDSFQDHINRGSVNPGTDYTAAFGSKVVSVANGTVTDIDNTTAGSGGRMIHIDHDDGTGADYLHLSDSTSFVTLGQHVTQGMQIALSGASGFGSEHGYGAHLHISYRTVTGHAYTYYHSIDFDAYVRSLGLT